MSDKNYNYLVGETDPQVWVDAWLEIIEENPSIPTDPGTMLGWFANAIASGEMAVANQGKLEDFFERLDADEARHLTDPDAELSLVRKSS